MIVLSLNAGSSSLRFEAFDCSAHGITSLFSGERDKLTSQNAPSNQQALAYSSATEQILQQAAKQLAPRSIDAIGCRVVHGGERFVEPQRVTSDVINEVRALKKLAPLHNELNASVLESCAKIFPALPMVAVFDTAFHHTLPPEAALYALPLEFSMQHHIRRYGFHGIAHQSVSKTLFSCLKKGPLGTRVITCHLGNGASVCAIRDGISVDTSMGFTPLEGLIMGTRCGDIDAGLILSLLKDGEVSIPELSFLLNHKSGLLGLSGISSDLRELEAAAPSNPQAAFAIDAFALRVAKYVGAYAAVLGGLDAIAFSGGIGEHSSAMRSRICKKLGFLGIHVSETDNTTPALPARISAPDSPVAAWVIPAQENLQIATLTYGYLTHA
ncbi:MAG: acetate/propionate family kinase [Deltaproteobacteria bacterium]|nr:acetate/propionate family kinase [Deltaproteobacteria bacterium]